MTERLKDCPRILSIQRYAEVLSYLDSKCAIGLFHKFDVGTSPLDHNNTAARLEITGITNKIWDKVVGPELRILLKQTEHRPWDTRADRARYHILVLTEEP